jgi:hypothetical protein
MSRRITRTESAEVVHFSNESRTQMWALDLQIDLLNWDTLVEEKVACP